MQSIDVQYLAMINHPDHRPQGVRRCILEPSSNRLAEQCGVGHLAQTTVHLLLHGERLPDLIPHTLDILYIANNLHLNKIPHSFSNCLTKLLIGDVFSVCFNAHKRQYPISHNINKILLILYIYYNCCESQLNNQWLVRGWNAFMDQIVLQLEGQVVYIYTIV